MAAGQLGAAFMEGFGGAVPGALLGLATLPSQIIQGRNRLDFDVSAEKARLGAVNFQTQQDTANRLMGMYAQAGENAAGRNLSVGHGADLDYMRQFGAQMAQANIFDPKRTAEAYDVAKRGQALRTNPAAKEQAFQEVLNRNRQQGFNAAIPGALTFGETNLSRRFTNL
jgi:hypothetical protein